MWMEDSRLHQRSIPEEIDGPYFCRDVLWSDCVANARQETSRHVSQQISRAEVPDIGNAIGSSVHITLHELFAARRRLHSAVEG